MPLLNKISVALGVTVLLLPLYFFLTEGPSFSAEGPGGSQGKISAHNLTVTTSIKGRSLLATDRISIGAAGELQLVIRHGARITRIAYGGRRIAHKISKAPDRSLKIISLRIPAAGKKGFKILSISFRETFPSIYTARKQIIKRGIAYIEDGVMGTEGVFLPSSSYWYPQVEGALALYNLMVNMPRGYTTVSEGDWKLHKHSTDRNFDRWQTSRPIDGLDLVAARFRVTKVVHKGIKVYTFFLKRDSKLSRVYTERTKKYLDLYSGLLGDYPFKKFAVVESFLPTGYGMPSFTLLGSKVLRLPFIPDTSLGHEIAHSWWGNSVYVDDNLGNWAEAITTYTADYLYDREKGMDKAREFRFKKLEGYKNFAGQAALSLKDFIDATDPAARAVGYNKGMMVFSMLEDEIGREAFNLGLKEFYKKNAFNSATWTDIKEAFESAAGRSLKGFFDQWVLRAGGPSLKLEAVYLNNGDSDFTVSFKIKQTPPFYKMKIPVVFHTRNGASVEEAVKIERETGEFLVTLKSRPLSIEVDPDYRVFRVLSEMEVPPSLSVVFGDKEAVMVLPAALGPRLRYAASSALLSKDYGLTEVTDSDLQSDDYIREKSVFIFGGPGENALFDKIKKDLPASVQITTDGFTIGADSFSTKDSVIALAFKNPSNPSKNICVFFGGGDKRKILQKAKRIRYFSKYSYIVLKGGSVALKGVFPGKKSLTHNFVQDDGAPGGSVEPGKPSTGPSH